MTIVLALRKFGLAFGQKTILKSIDLDLDHTGVYLLMGPCGSGKSSLLKALAGHFAHQPLMRQWGKAIYRGYPLQTGNYPLIMQQKADLMRLSLWQNLMQDLPEREQLTRAQQLKLIERLLHYYRLENFLDRLDEPILEFSLAQRRMISLVNLAARNPSLICIDEPTANIKDPAEIKGMIQLIRRIAADRAVLTVVHHREQAKQLGGTTFLLAGGVIQESNLTFELLDNPQSQAGIEFKQSGTCAVPSPDADPDSIDESYRNKYIPVPKRLGREQELIPFGPAGFQWVIEQQLAATPRPGIMADTLFDLKALTKVGIQTLICLEEQVPVDGKLLKEVGLNLIHFPIPDMQAPAPEEALALLKKIDFLIQSNQRLAIHCKGGLGRTGTMAAAYLIYQGSSAEEAIQFIRNKNPRMIQTEAQEQFLYQLEQQLASIP